MGLWVNNGLHELAMPNHGEWPWDMNHGIPSGGPCGPLPEMVMVPIHKYVCIYLYMYLNVSYLYRIYNIHVWGVSPFIDFLAFARGARFKAVQTKTT